MHLSEDNCCVNKRACNQNVHCLLIMLPLEYSDFETVNTKIGCGDDGDGTDDEILVEIFWSEHPALINGSTRNDTVLGPWRRTVSVGIGCASHMHVFCGEGVSEEIHGQKRKFISCV